MRRLFSIGLLPLAAMMIAPAMASASVSTSDAPTITGTAQVGATLTCQNLPPGDWTSNDGGTPTATDFQFSYSDDTSFPFFETGSGLANTYVVTRADIGHEIVCVQEETDEGAGDFTSETSPASTAATQLVTAGAAPTHTGAPMVSGPTEVGQPISCEDGTITWTPANGFEDSVEQSLQWVYSGTSTHAAGTPSDEQSYTPVAADLGKSLQCVLSATDAQTDGTATVDTAASAAVAPVASVTITAFSPAVYGNRGIWIQSTEQSDIPLEQEIEKIVDACLTSRC